VTKVTPEQAWILMDLKSKINNFQYNKLPLKNLDPLRMEVNQLVHNIQITKREEDGGGE